MYIYIYSISSDYSQMEEGNNEDTPALESSIDSKKERMPRMTFMHRAAELVDSLHDLSAVGGSCLISLATALRVGPYYTTILHVLFLLGSYIELYLDL